MYLFFKAIRTHGDVRTFMFQPDNLAVGLDFLNFICGLGDVLIEAHLADEFSTTALPLDIFDGDSFSEPMEQLEKEWQALLTNSEVPTGELPIVSVVDITSKRIEQTDQRIQNLELTIKRLELLAERAKKSTNDSILNHYQSLIDQYQQQIDRARVYRESVVAKHP